MQEFAISKVAMVELEQKDQMLDGTNSIMAKCSVGPCVILRFQTSYHLILCIKGKPFTAYNIN